jgi:putative lipoic acid-binding regulatory protein
VVHIDEKPEIEYPVEWGYRVIGEDEEKIRVAIDEVVDALEYSIKFSKTSKGGKYRSFEVKVTVPDESERDRVFRELKARNCVKMVI